MKLFDEKTGYLKLDELVEERASFRKVMEDGRVTDEEMQEQAKLVIAHMKKIEAQLGEEEKELLSDVLCELAVLYVMNAFREE